MAHYKTQFEIELDAYENFIDVHIESLDEKWSIVAKEVLGETADISRKGIQMLKVSRGYFLLPSTFCNNQQIYSLYFNGCFVYLGLLCYNVSLQSQLKVEKMGHTTYFLTSVANIVLMWLHHHFKARRGK